METCKIKNDNQHDDHFNKIQFQHPFNIFKQHLFETLINLFDNMFSLKAIFLANKPDILVDYGTYFESSKIFRELCYIYYFYSQKILK